MPAVPCKRALRAGLGIVILAAALGCHRSPPKSVSAQPRPPSPVSGQAARSSPAHEAAGSYPEFQIRAVSTREGEATWYDVPEGSLPERRAWPEEMTAASDTLHLNTYARVTCTENGKSVIVRITDRGIHKPGTIIDLDRAAGEALGIIKEGKARVKVEGLALKNAGAAAPQPQKAGAQVTPSKVSGGADAADEKATAEHHEEAAARP
jgi:rare lipoprotein A